MNCESISDGYIMAKGCCYTIAIYANTPNEQKVWKKSSKETLPNITKK